jgi:hypothetical protein
MDTGRSFRGWMAAFTVAGTLTLLLLAVEKRLRIPTAQFLRAPFEAAFNGANTQEVGIVLTLEPGLVSTSAEPNEEWTMHARRVGTTERASAARLLRRPPEPAANVALRAPIVSYDGGLPLPLHASTSNIDFLMSAMDRAFDSPMQTASASVQTIAATNSSISPLARSFMNERLSALPPPASVDGGIPTPVQLYNDLNQLREMLDLRVQWLGGESHFSGFISTPRPSNSYDLRTVANAHEVHALQQWLHGVERHLSQVINQGLEHDQTAFDLASLSDMVSQARQLGDVLTDHVLATRIHRAAYALQRRVALWSAVRGCLGGAVAPLDRPRSAGLARQDLLAALQAAEARLAETGDAANWRGYLLFQELEQWLEAAADSAGFASRHSATLAPLKVLSRLRYARLTPNQQRFLAQPEFEELASQLAIWGREPVDYRQLLTHVEFFEENSIGRANPSLANTVQLLRHAEHENQRQVAHVLNDHYRNSNLRLAISSQLIQKLLPDESFEVRPVRQRILGADTQGSSAVRTSLDIRLIPDESGWNINLGVLGNLASNTRATKGPAVFHNSSSAVIDSRRYIRLDPFGYRVTSHPTDVHSQDTLRRMITDFDGLPVIGDFVRLIVREQFEQKRSLAQRITRRIIADEADAELDRRLGEGLERAERELRERIVGPLEKMSLNPIVVSMNTTDERLVVRYRVATESQMAAHTPRPRAPTGSLLSMQIHESMLNNTIDQIGLTGRRWTLAELAEQMASAFQQPSWELPEDVPGDITIVFNPHRPATIELADGRLKLSLHIAELHQPERLHIENFTVVSHYVPLADGLRAELMRDGVVEIESRATRDRFRLRVIFASIFVANPQIPLVSEQWLQDERAQGLAVSQLEIRDGWLSVAISPSDSEQASQVAERSRQMKLQ